MKTKTKPEMERKIERKKTNTVYTKCTNIFVLMCETISLWTDFLLIIRAEIDDNDAMVPNN